MKNTKIIVDECCLKHSLNKKQKDLFEKILYELSEYHKCECLQLIKFVLKDIKKDNKLKNISRKFHNKSHFIRKNFSEFVVMIHWADKMCPIQHESLI